MANPSAETIIGLARNLIRTESGSDLPVATDDFMIEAVSDGNLKWAKAFQTNGAAPLVFQREWGVDLVADTAINDAAGITSSSTSITVDSQSFPDSAGVAAVWDDGLPDLFSYTSKTSTLFSGVSGLSFSHEDDDSIQALYKLPDNFGRLRQAEGYGDGVRLGGGLSFTSSPPAAGQFSLYDDGTSKYLWLPRGAAGSASVWYDKASSTIDSLDDTVDVPNEYKFFLVWHCVAFGLMGREQDANGCMFAQQQSEKILQKALQNRNVGKKIRARSFGRLSKDFTVINGQTLPL